MPNWCTNHIEIKHPDKSVIDEIAMLLLDDIGIITFKKILPIPDCLKHIETGNCIFNDKKHTAWYQLRDKDYNTIVKRALTEVEKNEYDKEIHDCPANWCREHWGTRCEPDPGTLITRPNDQKLCLSFLTAWTPPEPVIAEIRRRFSNCNIRGNYEEPLAGFAGTF